MSPATKPSTFTRRNWEIDAALFVSAVGAIISGIYFLFLPIGGFRGGRNPLYGIIILFDRHTWEDVHFWTGLVMIAAGLIHLAIHWLWVWNMLKRTGNILLGRCTGLNSRGILNLALNTVVGISFFLTSASGIYFYFFPESAHLEPYLLGMTRFAWNMIHTWGGVGMTAAALVHFYIHWNWVTKVSRRYFGSLLPDRTQTAPANTAGAAAE